MSSEQEQNTADNDYVSRDGQKDVVPVQKDEAPIESGTTDDSDAQLEKDDNEAIDSSNIVEGRTRGAAKSGGAYTEPEDEDEITDAAERS